MSKRMTIAGVVLAGIMLWAPSAMAEKLLVVNNGQLVKLDPATGVTTAINGAGAPVKVAVTPDGLFVYAAVYALDKVQKIDLTTLAVTDVTNPDGSNPFLGPNGIAIAPGGKKAYVTDYVQDAVFSIDLTTNKVTKKIEGFNLPSDIAINPNGRFAYVTAHLVDQTGMDAIIPLRLDTETPIGSLQRLTPTVDHAIIVSLDGVWVFATDGNQLVEWELPQGEKRLLPINMRVGYRMVLSPDSKDLYVAGYDNQIARIDARRGNVVTVKTLNAPQNNPPVALTLTMAQDGQTIYAQLGNDIVALDRNLEVKSTILQGAQPSPLVLASIPEWTNNVYFLGDSVTAGFGYCGGADVAGLRSCGTNNPFDNAWTQILSPLSNFSLGACSPQTTPVDDRCSNNNYQDGKQPWDAPVWTMGPDAPTIAYSYVIARNQSPDRSAQVRNWAMTGSTPADWDPGDDFFGTERGAFAPQLERIRNSYVVMTLGANPLLSEYLNVTIPPGVALKKGECADSTRITRDGGTYAATLNADPAHASEGNGVGYCLQDEWLNNLQEFHLRVIYNALLGQGNRVIVVGYPPVCPWSFGSWQPAPNLIPGYLGGGPAIGKPCDDPANSLRTANPHSEEMISQADQAFFLADLANGWISQIVSRLNNPNIVFLPPSADWKNHQAWTNSSWVFLNDTWVHPSAAGHQQIALSVLLTMCQYFNHWCPGADRVAHWILP